MQRQGCSVETFSEDNIDPRFVSNNTDMSHQTSLNNILNPVENRFASSTVSSDEASCVHSINHGVQSFNGWNESESSSCFHRENQAVDDEMKVEERWPSSVNAHAVVGSRSEDRQSGPVDAPNLPFPERVSIGSGGNQVRSGPLILRGSSSNHSTQNVNMNAGGVGDGGKTGHYEAAVAGPEHLRLGGKEIQRASSSGISSEDISASFCNSEFITEEPDSGLGSSHGGWGSSCKRKALEGTSAHSYAGGSSSCFPQTENDVWHTGSTHHSTSSNVSLSTTSRNSPSFSNPEQLNHRNGFGMRGVSSDAFHSSSDSGSLDHLRHLVRRVSAGHQQEAAPFTLSTAGGTRPSNYLSLGLRSTSPASNSGASQGQSHNMHASVSSRNAYPLPWSGASFLRSGAASSSPIPGERIGALREDVNLRGIHRNNVDRPMFVPVSEVRNIAQDSAGWNLSTGNMSTSGNPHSSRITPSSIHPVPPPVWFPHPDHTAHNQQRFTEFAPWSLFPSMDSESEGLSGHFPSLSSGPSASPQETVMPSASTSHGHNQSLTRSAFLMEGRGDDVLGMPRSLRALAADIEGRHRLISEIRQVLNAMRRGENLRVEDFLLFDPFIYHGMAEMHDRHRDMRLDVDNMSYEELLALEERMGDVSTGLSEETIVQLMKQKKHLAIALESQADLEPCCICREEYLNGDDLGMLECGHNFHSNCIKQWLMHKNLCPICKTTALPT
ncbi:hypothetical protein K2173_001158 [Erythroxylum novogranatense]|uniref:RING-type E3 ubiquitin transferase n=1 Tax=Erythroxylum novogranatense TaxID=1862640 RepID=A0AAV8TL15_9ROSI|nr:hypothetical protein K2173_001158 [Erythroxylum novogranatense]